MQLPKLTNLQDRQSMVQQFMGLNQNLRISENEFADMLNITNDYYPAIGNRKKRGYVQTLSKPQGMIGGQYLAYVNDNKLYYNDELIETLEEGGERQLVMIGAYLCVFPDGFIYNTYDKTKDHVVNEVTTALPPTLTLCKIDGTNFDDSNCITSATEPSDKTKYWLDTSADPVVLKLYSDSLRMWQSVGTTYVKIQAAGIGVGFGEYDAATISGVDKDRPEIYNNWDFNQSSLIYARGDDYLIVAGIINKVFTNSQNITVKREMPEMDFICEQDNRLWGCSSEHHEIYGCKQGDPKNWNCFAGLDSDSYAATVGTQGDFTGICPYNGTVYFFKEEGFHRLYGTKPANYELTYKPGRGIQKGSSKSVAIVNETMIFKSRDNICAYAGGIDIIGEKLGLTPYYDAVAGGYRNKYFLSMRDADYNYSLFVYDTTKGTWCREDATQAKYMAYAADGFYILDNDNKLYVVNDEAIMSKFWPEEELLPDEELIPGPVINGNIEKDIEWSFTSGDIGMDSPFQKYIKRFVIRILLDVDAYLKVEVDYDSMDAWETVWQYYSTKKRSYQVVIPVVRADHIKIRVSGRGEMRLFSIAKVVEEGSDQS